MTEIAKAKIANNDVRQTLDQQKLEIAQKRHQAKQQDLNIGARMVTDDLEQMTREAQVKAFKRHEMAK